ncbi:Hsp20/alpha crystallin family protein [Pseudomonadota bacterium]
MEEKDIEVEYSNGSLSISAEKKSSKEEKGENFYRQECSYGSFYKTIGLPEDIDDKKIDANYKNGVLKIDINRLNTNAKSKKKISLKKS